MGVTGHTGRRWLTRLGEPPRPAGRRPTADVDAIAVAARAGESPVAVASRLGVDIRTVRRWWPTG
jgi:hypothetical protein